MALEIIIVKDESKPYWEDHEAIRFGDVDPVEWESFFFKDVDIERYTDYGDRKAVTYEEYYSATIAALAAQFPLISRVDDYYSDAFFSSEEIPSLTQELLALQQVVRFEASIRFLGQLLLACEVANQRSAGMQLIAD